MSAKRCASRTSGRPGPVHLSLPSDLLEERVESNAIVWPMRGAPARACAHRGGRRRGARRDRGRGAADHPRRPQLSNVSGRALLGEARSRDADAGGHPGKPARHRGRDARRILRSGAPRRPDRAHRQGARLHDPLGDRLVLRSRRAADRDRSRGRAGRARREEKGDGLCSAASRTRRAAETLIARAASE